MATGKMNYWMKLQKDFLFGDAVGFLMTLPAGGKYVVFFWQLCALAINTGGELFVKIGKIKFPYDAEKIRQECKYYTAEEVSEALNFLENLGLICKQRNGIYKITDFDKMVGSETDYAAQKREQRRRKAAEQNEAGTPADTQADNGMDDGADIVHTDIRYKSLDIRFLDIKNLDTPISGGGVAEAARVVEEFLGIRGTNMEAYLGVTEDALRQVEEFTKSIFAVWANRHPAKCDTANVFLAVKEQKEDSQTGIWSLTFPKDKQDLLMYAFEQALNAGHPGEWNYINGILRNLSMRNITTLVQAEQSDLNRN